MKLGAFSISLSVKDIQKSKDFYETLGFTVFHGDMAQGWLILDNHGTKIGLFQGMFPKNMMTFNPGWDSDAKPLENYTDVRDIQAKLKSAGFEMTSEVDSGTSGPASCMLSDPDGNPILIDQHV